MVAAMRRVAYQLRDLARELLYPPRCSVCQRGGTYFCSACLAKITSAVVAACPRCDRPLDDTNPLHVHHYSCQACHNQFPSLNGLRVFAPYGSPLKEAIHALKYTSFPAVATPLGQKLAALWQERGIPVDGVLPVPLHPERVRERGYNQSALLGEVLCDTLGVPFYDNFLQRIRPTRPQVGLTRQDRLQNVADAFEADPTVASGKWLLVDDVCTSGATLEGCAAALRAKGATQVWAIVLARPLQGDDT
jgi:ComF family protein